MKWQHVYTFFVLHFTGYYLISVKWVVNTEGSVQTPYGEIRIYDNLKAKIARHKSHSNWNHRFCNPPPSLGFSEWATATGKMQIILKSIKDKISQVCIHFIMLQIYAKMYINCKVLYEPDSKFKIQNKGVEFQIKTNK